MRSIFKGHFMPFDRFSHGSCENIQRDEELSRRSSSLWDPTPGFCRAYSSHRLFAGCCGRALRGALLQTSCLRVKRLDGGSRTALVSDCDRRFWWSWCHLSFSLAGLLILDLTFSKTLLIKILMVMELWFFFGTIKCETIYLEKENKLLPAAKMIKKINDYID